MAAWRAGHRGDAGFLMSSRATTVLDRFPRHLGLTSPGKRIGAVVEGLADGLDVQTGQISGVRTAHRFGDADLVGDVVGLARLHGLGAAATEPLRRRMDALDESPSRAERLDHHRATFQDLIEVHRTGNGTTAGLLGATAAYLGYDVERIDHTEDRWWHLATCTDRLARDSDVEDVEPIHLALEENPHRPADVVPSPRRHGAAFEVLRGGLEAVEATVVVSGIEDRTMSPMVVNIDLGLGVAFTGAVPDGAELRFHASGSVTLDDDTGASPVDDRTMGFRGAVFASDDSHRHDFVFADADAGPDDPFADDSTEPPRVVEGMLPHHRGHFAVTTPVDDLFAADAAVPHSIGRVEPVVLPLGRSRWMAFAGSAAWTGPRHTPAPPIPVAPRTRSGVFDRTVFAIDPGTPEPMAVGFEWQEREAFAVKVWVPFVLADLDDAEPAPGTSERETPFAELLRTVLDRHRAAGIRLTVDYADPRWLLGTGVIRGLRAVDPLGLVIRGTSTWPEGTTQPDRG